VSARFHIGRAEQPSREAVVVTINRASAATADGEVTTSFDRRVSWARRSIDRALHSDRGQEVTSAIAVAADARLIVTTTASRTGCSARPM